MQREQIYAKLAETVQNLTSITVSRKVVSIDDVAPADMANGYIIQVEDVEDVKQRGKGLPPIYVLMPTLYLYMVGQDVSQINTQLLNPVLDTICDAFSPSGADISPGGAVTLGGLVSHCYVSGRIVIDDGTQGGGILAVIPLEILAV